MPTVGELTKGAARTVDLDEAFNKLEEHYDKGLPPGRSTGWPGFDKFFQFTPEGQLNVATGAPSAGKSEWVDSLAINMMVNYSWKVLSYSPESHPLEFHFRKLCEKISDKHFSGEFTGYERMTKEELHMCKAVFKENFVSIDTNRKVPEIKNILQTIRCENFHKKVDMVILDPWNKLEHSMVNKGESRTELIGKRLTEIQIFARQFGISFWVVAHPAKPVKMKNGDYPNLTLYDVADSAHFYNMVDNGFIFTRDRQSKLNDSGIVKCSIEKIKNRFYGKMGECYFKFDPRTSKFSECLPTEPEEKEEKKDAWT
ncbi:MAG: AAA family ATPase [bacterium]|nr:AAA family ATPase [bacterium]